MEETIACGNWNECFFNAFDAFSGLYIIIEPGLRCDKLMAEFSRIEVECHNIIVFKNLRLVAFLHNNIQPSPRSSPYPFA